MKLLILLVFLVSTGLSADTLPPVDSGKDIEVKIAKLLKDKLKIDVDLKVTDDKGENLRIAALFKANKKNHLPKVAAFVDTKILSKNKKNGKVLSQVISIFSIAEITLKTDNRLKLLEWANTWNNNPLPIRIQIANNSVIAAVNLVTTRTSPIDEDFVVANFLGIIQIWPTIMKSLKNSKLMK